MPIEFPATLDSPGSPRPRLFTLRIDEECVIIEASPAQVLAWYHYFVSIGKITPPPTKSTFNICDIWTDDGPPHTILLGDAVYRRVDPTSPCNHIRATLPTRYEPQPGEEYWYVYKLVPPDPEIWIVLNDTWRDTTNNWIHLHKRTLYRTRAEAVAERNRRALEGK